MKKFEFLSFKRNAYSKISKRLFCCIFVLFGFSIPFSLSLAQNNQNQSTQQSTQLIEIDNQELLKLKSKGLKIIDVRTETEWKQTGVIESIQFASYSDENGRVDSERFIQKINQIAAKNEAIILVCRTGNRSEKAFNLLRKSGDQRPIYHLKNGMNGWLSDKQSVKVYQAALK